MSDLVVIDGGNVGSTDVTTPAAPLLSAWWDTTLGNVRDAARWMGARAGDVVDLVVVTPVQGLVEGATGIQPTAADPAAPNQPPAPGLPPWVIPAAVVVTVVVGVALLATVARPRIPFPFGSFGRF